MTPHTHNHRQLSLIPAWECGMHVHVIDGGVTGVVLTQKGPRGEIWYVKLDGTNHVVAVHATNMRLVMGG